MLKLDLDTIDSIKVGPIIYDVNEFEEGTGRNYWRSIDFKLYKRRYDEETVVPFQLTFNAVRPEDLLLPGETLKQVKILTRIDGRIEE
jgi:hypothetical protein